MSEPSLTELSLPQAIALAADLNNRGQLQDAANICQAILQADPSNVDTQKILGSVLLKAGQAADALPFFAAVQRHTPDALDNLLFLAEACWQTERQEDAIDTASLAVKAHPQSALACNNLAIYLHRAGRREDALHWYQQALAIIPEFAQAHLGLACIHGERGSIQSQIAHLLSAVMALPGDPLPLARLQSALHHPQAHFCELLLLQKCTERLSGDARSWHLFGIALWEAGAYEAAIAAYDQAIALFPSAAGLHEDRRKLAFLHLSNGLADLLRGSGRAHEAAKYERDQQAVVAVARGSYDEFVQQCHSLVVQARKAVVRQQHTMTYMVMPLPSEMPLVSFVVCSVDVSKQQRQAENLRQKMGTWPYEIQLVTDAISLAEGYNRGLSQAKGDVLVFCHDDIEIVTPDFPQRLLVHLACHDVVGLAGTTRLTQGTWGICGFPHLSGAVAHRLPTEDFQVSVYGHRQGAAIQAVDGIFIACCRELAKRVGFDAMTFDGFHCYDLDFSFRAYLQGYRIGIAGDIGVIHDSMGGFDDRWKHYKKRFEEKFAADLNVAPQQEGRASPNFILKDVHEVSAFFELFGPGFSDSPLDRLLEGAQAFLPAPAQALHGVAIVVCVHDALDDVQRCLQSIVQHSDLPYRLILVDDGSGTETAHWLQQFATDHSAILLRNDNAQGYTRAANRGMAAAAGDDYVILLNSDTEVFSGWLKAMIACARSSLRIGLVGPLSNRATWQSLPDNVDEEGEAPENLPPDELSLTDWAMRIARHGPGAYPRLAFLNGFCLLIKKEVIGQLGFFDEGTFGKGYGEENDYCLRARAAGWELAVADNVYVHHSESRSYSHDRRRSLSAAADTLLRGKHGHQQVDDGIRACRFSRGMAALRARLRVAVRREHLRDEGRQRFSGQRLAFLLPIQARGGGANVVFFEAKAMKSMGVDVMLINLEENRQAFDVLVAEHGLDAFYLGRPEDLPEFAHQWDVLVATAHHTTHWLVPLAGQTPNLTLAYYIQDFEPFFYMDNRSHYADALASYSRVPGIRRLTKTAWNRDIVQQQTGLQCTVVGPSVDLDTFLPDDRPWENLFGHGKGLRIAAMIRPTCSYRGATLTMRVLARLAERHSFDALLFGVSPLDADYLALPRAFPHRNLGILDSRQIARLLSQVDIFVDFSKYQAMGLTAMEAMSCGCAVIVPRRGGANSFATEGEDALFADTSSEDDCLMVMERLFSAPALLRRLQTNALASVLRFAPEAAAYAVLDALFGKSSGNELE